MVCMGGRKEEIHIKKPSAGPCPGKGETPPIRKEKATYVEALRDRYI